VMMLACSVLSVPDQVASMTFVDVTDTSAVVVWSQPHFTNGILTGMCVIMVVWFCFAKSLRDMAGCFVTLQITMYYLKDGACSL